MIRFLGSLALCGLLVLSAAGQNCPTGQVFLKNDLLPAIPSGATAVSVIQGLCEGEGIGCVFDVSGIGPVVKVHDASVGFFNAVGANGVQAGVNLRIHDGITWSGGIPNLGPLVFDFTATSGASIGINSHAINTQNISNNNVLISSGKLVVTWIMDFNPLGGNCQTGYQTNFGTDNASLGGGCTTPPQQNLILIDNQGWRDPRSASVLGFPLCPFFYNGNWVIRACVENANPVFINLFPGTTTIPGAFSIAQFVATPAEAGQIYIPAISCTPGLFAIPGSSFNAPVIPDFCTNLYFNDPVVRSIFQLTPAGQNFGVLGANGQAQGLIQIPANVVAPPGGIPIHLFFVTLNGNGQITRVSNRATLTII